MRNAGVGGDHEIEARNQRRGVGQDLRRGSIHRKHKRRRAELPIVPPRRPSAARSNVHSSSHSQRERAAAVLPGAWTARGRPCSAGCRPRRGRCAIHLLGWGMAHWETAPISRRRFPSPHQDTRPATGQFQPLCETLRANSAAGTPDRIVADQRPAPPSLRNPARTTASDRIKRSAAGCT